MKRLFSYILILIAVTALLASCSDDTFSSDTLADGQIGLKLALNLPGGEQATTRTGGTNAETGTANGQGFENWIQANDVRLLLFSKGGTFAEEVTNLKITGAQGSTLRFLEGKTANPYEGDIEIVVLINLKSRDVNPATTGFEGKTIEETYKLLKYTYGNEAWTLSEDKRLPMWGNCRMTLRKGVVNRGNVNVYRALAKINVLVNEGTGLDNFELRNIRVYYTNTQGYCAPLPTDAAVEEDKTYFTNTSIPAGSVQQGVSNPLSFTWEEEISTNAFENQVYVPESNNQNPGTNKKPICLVVGGIYDGEGLVQPGEVSYYRIDFKDDLESGNKEDLRVYDVIRNHSYVFNIRTVSRPGTPTPEEALENEVVGMSVSIEDWDNVPMRGIPDQYTLTTSKSVVAFDNKVSEDIITVTTDYGMDENDTENGKWEIVEISGNIETDVDGKNPREWFRVVKNNDNRTIHIEAVENHGITREGYFYVQTGNLRKQITVRQEQPETANCYVVNGDRDITHELIVAIKGNGTKGLSPEDGVQLDKEATVLPDNIGIIWETKQGLIELIDAVTKETVLGGKLANYDKGKGTIRYRVNISNASIGGVAGGNALIGAFKNNKIIWSWHIWICPDMVKEGEEKIIDKSCIEDWTLNGYQILDRNLGALSNKPGVASLGLLYQWGRKDPFIGASATNDNYSGNGRLWTIEYFNKKWAVDTSGSNTNIPYTIENPTILTYDGLSEKMSNGGYLWGTNAGLQNVKDLGTKTIYDPCPAGYRVPPVDAFVFTRETTTKKLVQDATYEITLHKNESVRIAAPVYIGYQFYTTDQIISGDNNGNGHGTTFQITPCHYETTTTVSKDNLTKNWNENLIYIPHKASSWSGSYYTGNYVKNADYYGFYLNYKELKEPDLAWGWKTDKEVHYDLSDYTNLTWLPISGAYDPHKNSELKFNNVEVTQGSSLSVNSFLWTNSSVKVSGETRPAAMFLHGTEVNSTINGRHIHALQGTSSSDNIIAKSYQAGAVRCVRDVKKDFSASNIVPYKASLRRSSGSKTTIRIIVVNTSWRITDSGAPWLKIDKESGSFDKGNGQDITITALETNNTGSERTATVSIQIKGETAPRTFRVTQSARY